MSLGILLRLSGRRNLKDETHWMHVCTIQLIGNLINLIINMMLIVFHVIPCPILFKAFALVVSTSRIIQQFASSSVQGSVAVWHH